MNPRLEAVLRSLLSFCIDLALLGLGWGVNDLPGYFANPARVGVLVVIVGHAIFNTYIRIHPPKTPRRRLEHIGLYRLQLMAIETIYVFGPYTDRHGLGVLPEAVRWWGVGLFVLGTLLMIWTSLRLPERRIPVDVLGELDGAPAGVVQNIHDYLRGTGEDFRSGPFRWLRYPSFTGLVLAGAGMGLAFRSGVCLVISALMLLIVMVRARQMDDIFQRRFGSAWAVYSSHTWRILPFLY